MSGEVGGAGSLLGTADVMLSQAGFMSDDDSTVGVDSMTWRSFDEESESGSRNPSRDRTFSIGKSAHEALLSLTSDSLIEDALADAEAVLLKQRKDMEPSHTVNSVEEQPQSKVTTASRRGSQGNDPLSFLSRLSIGGNNDQEQSASKQDNEPSWLPTKFLNRNKLPGTANPQETSATNPSPEKRLESAWNSALRAFGGNKNEEQENNTMTTAEQLELAMAQFRAAVSLPEISFLAFVRQIVLDWLALYQIVGEVTIYFGGLAVAIVSRFNSRGEDRSIILPPHVSSQDIRFFECPLHIQMKQDSIDVPEQSTKEMPGASLPLAEMVQTYVRALETLHRLRSVPVVTSCETLTQEEEIHLRTAIHKWLVNSTQKSMTRVANWVEVQKEKIRTALIRFVSEEDAAERLAKDQQNTTLTDSFELPSMASLSSHNPMIWEIELAVSVPSALVSLKRYGSELRYYTAVSSSAK